jgi:hypothetical protein
MKVIERSPIGGEVRSTSSGDRIRGIWKFGLSWDRDIQAQSTLIRNLGKSLDSKYTLVNNVALPSFALPVPVVLVGPTGVRTFYVSGADGIFRYREDVWYELDHRSQSYKLSRPNLVRRTELMSRAIDEYLFTKGFYLEETESVLFFAHPGVHVDTPDSPVHLLYADGVEGYASGLKQEDVVLDPIERERITELLTNSRPAPPKVNENLRSLVPPKETVGVGEVRMKPWQWVVIFILTILMLITIIITAYLILNLG